MYASMSVNRFFTAMLFYGLGFFFFVSLTEIICKSFIYFFLFVYMVEMLELGG